MKYLKIYYFLLIGLLLLIGINSAEAVSSKDLIENAEDYDGKIVSFQGEVIGDIMRRGDFAWINVSDVNNTIGVWISADLVNKIRFTGDYKHRGDYVKIVGKFHRACLLHDGELDIHAKRLKILNRGQQKKEVINRTKQKAAFAFLGAVICLGILKALMFKYKRT